MVAVRSIKKRALRSVKATFRKLGVEVSWYRGDPSLARIKGQQRLAIPDYPTGLGLRHAYDTTSVRGAFVNYLCANGCWIRPLFSENEVVQKICYKHDDWKHIFSVVSKFAHEGVRVRFAAHTNFEDHRTLKLFYFVDGEAVLGADQYAFDPWQSDGERIYSYSTNNLVSSVPRMYQERTPLAVSPYFLQGDEEFDVSYSASLQIPEAASEIVPYPIDLVFTWVNGADPDWYEKRTSFLPSTQLHHADSHGEARFRDREELRYAMRSVHSFAKFVRKIYLVTDDQVPHWLDASHEKIELVSHRDIFPDESWLPVFNSHAIEANLHRIPNLSEHFLYMNDDLMFWNKCRPADFFSFSGSAKIFLEDLPNVYGDALASTPAWRAAALNVNRLMIKRFGTTLYTHHLHVPFSMRKSVMEEIWQEFPDVMEQTSRARFRSSEDVSPASFFHPVYAYLTGEAILAELPAVRTGLDHRSFERVMTELSRDAGCKCVCINDAEGDRSILNSRVFTSSMLRKFPQAAPWENDQ